MREVDLIIFMMRRMGTIRKVLNASKFGNDGLKY